MRPEVGLGQQRELAPVGDVGRGLGRLQDIPLFRFAIGCVLAAYFLSHARTTAEVLGGSGVCIAELLPKGVGFRSSWLVGHSTIFLRTIFFGGGLIALAIGAGVVARLWALPLYLLCISTHWALFPLVCLDDYVTNVAVLFLALLPSGRVFASRSAPAQPASPRSRPNAAVLVLFLNVMFLYVSGTLGKLSGVSPSAERNVVLASRLIPVIFFVAGSMSRAVGIALQLGLHAYLAATTLSIYANLLLAATSLLFWSEIHSTTARKVRLDASAMGAVLFTLLTIVNLGTSWLGWSAVSMASGRLLADVGLLPTVLTPEIAPPDSFVYVMADEIGGGERAYSVPHFGLRSTLLLAQLEDAANQGRLALSACIAGRHCRDRGFWGQRGRVVVGKGEMSRLIAEFECGPNGSLSSVH